MLFFIVLLGTPNFIYAHNTNLTDGGKIGLFQKKRYQYRTKNKCKNNKSNHQENTSYIQGKNKTGAILMAVLTGPLGGHRIYLGTTPFIPIIYAITLGGGMGLLPLVDIIAILITTDLKSFENNDDIFMW